MKYCQTTPIVILLFFHIFFIFGCNNSDSSKIEKMQKNVPSIVGTWQQTAIGGEKVTGVVVKIIFSEQTLTMDAPGCLIIGDYTAVDGLLSFTITSARGERCAPDQKIGKSDSVHYAVTDSQLTLTPLLAGKEGQLEYQRVDESRPK